MMTANRARLCAILGAGAIAILALRRWFVPILTKTSGTWIGTPRP